MHNIISKLCTPVFLINEEVLQNRFSYIQHISSEKKLKYFFPLKTMSLVSTLEKFFGKVDGFATSSLFEARLAYEVTSDKKVHYTSPGLRENEIGELLNLCDGISFNSLSQWQRFRGKAIGSVDCALRINPQLSLVKDKRYDPSRKHSRLGAPLNQVIYKLENSPSFFDGIMGVHFHTNCDSEDFQSLLETVQHLDQKIPALLRQCRWINLGGGYLFSDQADLRPFEQAVQLLQDKYNLEVIIEPGASVVRDACYLVSSVIDLIESDGKHIAVLDTTVNHMPEVFEYQFQPDILNESEDGQYCYILEGATCLAGDHFGEYTFDKPLEIDSKIVFTGMGAYTMVKAHMFNGVNLPSIYTLTEQGDLVFHKQYTYEDFKNRCGVDEKYESIRETTEIRGSTRTQRFA